MGVLTINELVSIFGSDWSIGHSQSPALFGDNCPHIGRQVLPRLIDHHISADFCGNVLSRQSGWSMNADKATMQKSASADFAWRQNPWL
jgi:hypothetical protein